MERQPRLSACRSLEAWLSQGGPLHTTAQPRSEAPPLVHVSRAICIEGDEANITLRASKPVEAGTIVLAVAMQSVLHPRSDAVPLARRNLLKQASKAYSAIS